MFCYPEVVHFSKDTLIHRNVLISLRAKNILNNLHTLNYISFYLKLITIIVKANPGNQKTIKALTSGPSAGIATQRLCIEQLI